MENKEVFTFQSGLEKVAFSEKLRFDLIPHELLFRLAKHYTNSLKKYPANNWRKSTKEESIIFKQAAMRHLMKWMNDLETEEDNATACIWNIMSYEWINKHKHE